MVLLDLLSVSVEPQYLHRHAILGGIGIFASFHLHASCDPCDSWTSGLFELFPLLLRPIIVTLITQGAGRTLLSNFSAILFFTWAKWLASHHCCWWHSLSRCPFSAPSRHHAHLHQRQRPIYCSLGSSSFSIISFQCWAFLHCQNQFPILPILVLLKIYWVSCLVSVWESKEQVVVHRQSWSKRSHWSRCAWVACEALFQHI